MRWTPGFPREPSGGTRSRRGRDRERGQATVEFAFVLPLVVLAALAVIQVALVVRDELNVVHAAREAVRAASVDPDPNAAVRAARRTLPHAEVEVGSRPRVGEEITVTVRYHSVTSVPLVGALFPDPDLHASATMRVER
ncbi:MAG TPA: TadE family protein [Acidimicrobiia bacterium]|nr:TadE family protein [Acidimicrobiia bacterium]